MAAPEQKQGIVAILDALGAASYDDIEIAEFLRSRQRVVQLRNDKSERVAAILNVARVKTYTFNDKLKKISVPARPLLRVANAVLPAPPQCEAALRREQNAFNPFAISHKPSVLYYLP